MGNCCPSRSDFGTGVDGTHRIAVASVPELVEWFRERAWEVWRGEMMLEEDGIVPVDMAIPFLCMDKYLPVFHIDSIVGRAKDGLDFMAFRDAFVELHLSLPPLEEIFREVDQNGSGSVSAKELQRFFKTSSNGMENPSENECLQMIHKYQGQMAVRMQLDGFTRLMTDGKANFFGRDKYLENVHQDMHHPLSEYYICCSHNTYLMGNQYNSKSSGEAIKRALLLGVRVIELDTWEDSNGVPICTHGHTMVTPTTFEECVIAIKKWGHVVSDYPVILTIENHCGLEAQRAQVEILSDVLGEMLYLHEKISINSENDEHNKRKYRSEDLHELMKGPDEWMSPSDFRKMGHMVIIRDKPRKRTKKKDTTSARRASVMIERHKRKSVAIQEKQRRRSAGELRSSSSASNSSLLAVEEDEDRGNEEEDDAVVGEEEEGPEQKQLQKKTLQRPLSTVVEETDISLKPVNEEDQQQQQQQGGKVRSTRSMRHKISSRVSRTLRPLSGRVSSLTSNSSQNSSSDDESELLDPEELERLHEIAETVRFKSANRDLLRLMYIKNVKLRYKLIPNAMGGVIFEQPKFVSSSSIDERKLNQLVKTNERISSLREYTRKHILRVYPMGQRVDSSNFDPVPAWNAGVQMVALNYQTNSVPVWLSQGMFANNGGCGYVLKPEGMGRRRRTSSFKHKLTASHSLPSPMSLRVKVVSGHYLMPQFSLENDFAHSTPNELYVEISTHGSKDDVLSFRTGSIRKNCFNPNWNQTCIFELHDPDTVLMLFQVKDGDDMVIGQTCLPLPCIRQGYRMIPLKTPSCVPMKYSYLFCQINWKPLGT